MRNRSLKIMIGILSIIIASLFLSIIEITKVVEFGNKIVEFGFMGLLLLAIAEGIYFVSILISGVIAKYMLWRSAINVKDVNKNNEKCRKRKEKLEQLKKEAIVNET